MIIIKLQGGLGNQMFQYAAAKSISGGKPVYFDLSFLSSNTQSTNTFTVRSFELSIFDNIPFHQVSKFIKQMLECNKAIYLYLKHLFVPRGHFIYQTEENEFINLGQIKSSPVYLDGYFQNEAYFKNIRQQLLHDFQFPVLLANSKKIKINSVIVPVSVHVRRGDYMQPAINAFHGLVPLSYYQQAKAKLETLVANPYYFVFSDDPEWCSQNFSFWGDNITIMSNPSDNNWEDMYLMSICKHNIIANSSYSWWGAWLNQNPDKVVIAPKKWFASVNTDIVPLQWIKL